MGQSGFQNTVNLFFPRQKLQKKKLKKNSVFGGKILGKGHAQQNIEQAVL